MKNLIRKIFSLILCAALLAPVVPVQAEQTLTSREVSPTLKVPFTIKNKFFTRYGVEWAAATEKQRKDFLKTVQAEEKARQAKAKEFRKRQEAARKAYETKKKAEAARKRARLKAEADRKRAEEKRRASARQKMNALKAKTR